MGPFKISFMKTVFVLLIALLAKCCAEEQVVQRAAPLYPQITYDYPVGTQNFPGYSWDGQVPYTTYGQASGSFAKEATQVVAKDCHPGPIPQDTTSLASKTSSSASNVLGNEQTNVGVPNQTYEQPRFVYNPSSLTMESGYDQSGSLRASSYPYSVLFDAANLNPSLSSQYRSVAYQQPLADTSLWYSNVGSDSSVSRMNQPFNSQGLYTMGFDGAVPKYMERAYSYSGVQQPVVIRRPPYSYPSLYPTRGLPIQHVQQYPVLKNTEPTGLANTFMLRNMYKTYSPNLIPKYNFEGTQYDYGFALDGQNRASDTSLCRDKRQMESSPYAMSTYSVESPSYGSQGFNDQWRASSQMSHAVPTYESQYNSQWMNGFQPQQRNSFRYPQSRTVEGITQLVSGLTHLWPMINSYSGNTGY